MLANARQRLNGLDSQPEILGIKSLFQLRHGRRRALPEHDQRLVPARIPPQTRSGFNLQSGGICLAIRADFRNACARPAGEGAFISTKPKGVAAIRARVSVRMIPNDNLCRYEPSSRRVMAPRFT